MKLRVGDRAKLMTKDYIYPKGDPHSQIWVIVETPLKQDEEKGYLYSGSYGYIFDKMMRQAGLEDYYVVSRRPDPTDKMACKIIENDINHYKPPIILTVEEAGKHFCEQLKVKYTKQSKVSEEKSSAIEKYVGSLLSSSLLNYNHYILPIFGPETISRDWSLRDIVCSLELGKAKSELDYFRKYGKLEQLPARSLIYDFDGAEGFDKLCQILRNFLSDSTLLSNDIETVYPKSYAKKPSIFQHKHPGLPVTVGLAGSASRGISFNLFRDSPVETKELWRLLDMIFRKVPQLGQNFHNFDQNYYEMLGFEFGYVPEDTMIRHHVLWPELPHKLQFQTRQYTREIYYKDEGHGWSAKDLDKLKRYNCLDVCVTMEIYNAQEEEFKERPYLR